MFWPNQGGKLATTKQNNIHSFSQCLKKIFISHSLTHYILWNLDGGYCIRFNSIESNENDSEFSSIFFFCFVLFRRFSWFNQWWQCERQAATKKKESNETDWTQTKLPTNKHNCHQNCHFTFGSKTIDDNNQQSHELKWNFFGTKKIVLYGYYMDFSLAFFLRLISSNANYKPNQKGKKKRL